MKLVFVNTSSIEEVTDLKVTLNIGSGYYILAAYHSLATLLGFLGNTIVLIGSLKCKAVYVDKISALLVETLAVFDILILVFFCVPIWDTLLSRKWRLGPVICFFQGFLGFSFCMIEMTIIQGASLYRLYALLYPFSARVITRRQAYRIIAGITIFIISYMFCIHFMGQFWYFSPPLISCQPSGITDPRVSMVIYTAVATVLTMTIPVLTIIMSNVGILVKVSRSRDTGQTTVRFPGRRAVITVSLVAWTFVLSVIPMMVRILLQLSQVDMEVSFTVTSIEMLFLNTVLNPIIYMLTSRRFRGYLRFIWSSEKFEINPSESIVKLNPMHQPSNRSNLSSQM